MQLSVQVVVEPDGRLVFTYDDELAGLLVHGEPRTRRASHVEPGEFGIGWEADMSPIGGPRLGLFMMRGDALASELSFLETPDGVALMCGSAAGGARCS